MSWNYTRALPMNRPLTPPSPNGGEGGRRSGEGTSNIEHPTPNIEGQRESSLTSAFEVGCSTFDVRGSPSVRGFQCGRSNSLTAWDRWPEGCSSSGGRVVC